MKEMDIPIEHPSEADLILHHYGDAEQSAAITAHLASCDRCRSEHEQIVATLNIVGSEAVPHRGASYGAEVWGRLSGQLPDRTTRPGGVVFARGWGMAAAVAMMVIAAFLAGRYSSSPGTPRQATGAIPEPVRERVFLAVVGDHLERSLMMLVELLNADGGPMVEMTHDRKRAEELVTAGRIYRQSAAGAGDAAVAAVLEELERILLDVAHSPDELSHSGLESIQQRIRDKGILLKVRLIGSQVRQKEKAAVAATNGRRA